MRISDWSSDVCSSDLARWQRLRLRYQNRKPPNDVEQAALQYAQGFADGRLLLPAKTLCVPDSLTLACILWRRGIRSEEHTSELQSLMRISYAVFCLKKKKHKNFNEHNQ